MIRFALVLAVLSGCAAHQPYSPVLVEQHLPLAEAGVPVPFSTTVDVSAVVQRASGRCDGPDVRAEVLDGRMTIAWTAPAEAVMAQRSGVCRAGEGSAAVAVGYDFRLVRS